MSFPLLSPLTLSLVSLVAGIAFGKILAPQPGERREPDGGISSSEDSGLKSPDSAATDAAEPLADTGSPGTFANLPRPRQLDTLVRVSKQAENNPFLQLLIARIANDLPTEVLEELLSSLTEQKRARTPPANKTNPPSTSLPNAWPPGPRSGPSLWEPVANPRESWRRA